MEIIIRDNAISLQFARIEILPSRSLRSVRLTDGFG
jgi:hypothetical protein